MSSSEEEDRQYTTEDILSCVLQTKSKLGGMFNRPFRRSRKILEDNDTASNIDQESVSQNSLQSDYTPAGKSSHTSGAFSKRTPNIQENKSHGMCFSTSKLTRSVSTPEINFKFMPEPMSYTKSKAHRQVIFSSQRESYKSNTAVNKLANTDDLLKFSSNGEDKHFYNISKISEKSSSSSALLNSYREENTTDTMKHSQRNMLCINGKTSEDKENLDCYEPITVLDSKLPAVPITRQSYSRPHIKGKARNVLESITDNINKVKINDSEEDSPVKRSKSSSLSLQIGNSDLITVNGLNYFKMGKLGKGGSSVVYEVLDMQSKQRKAIKLVTLDEEDEATRESYKNEIKILQKLQYSPRVIKLYDHEEGPSYLKIVMEAGSVDLASILNAARQKNGKPIPSFTVQHYWQEMLLSVQVIHKEGIIHSDLKPANFLQVNGMLKLIDFGIASSVQQDMTSVFKDSQSGTYNFMSPESLNDIYSGPIISGKGIDKPTIKINVKSDVWSLGCILYNLVYSKTPFQHLVNPLQKLGAISNPKTKINFPPIKDENLLDVLQKCLQFDAYKRPTIQDLLCHPYLEESASLQVGGKETYLHASKMKTSSG